MGRNKFKKEVDRGEIKLNKKNKSIGLINNTGNIQAVDLSYTSAERNVESTNPMGFASTRRTALDTRRPAKSQSSTLHAILFGVLLVIVVSWALGY